MKRTLSSAAAAAVLALAAGAAQAQISDGVIKIGVLNDMSGLYADLTGPGSVIAAKLAVEDFGAASKGMKVEVVGADHQNKPDVGSTVARTWYDTDKVDVIVDVPTSSVALAVNQVTRDKGKAFLVSGAATSDLTGKACSPNTIHWTYDTWMLANGTGIGGRQDGRRHLVLPHRRLRVRPRARARHRSGGAEERRQGARQGAPPVPGTDFSSFLLQAQTSKAKIIGLANAGGDTINSIKQAAEFGIVKGGQNLAGLLVFLTDIHALGLQTAQGLIFTETFYWDLDDASRVRQALSRAGAAQRLSDDDPRRRLLLGAALPEGDRGDRRATTAPRWSSR